MGLDLDLDGFLDLSWILAQDLGFRAYRDLFEEVLGFLVFRARIFSSLGFHCGPQTESVYSLSPGFSKIEFFEINF